MAEGPKTQMPARRKARKRALDVLYEADLRDLPVDTVLSAYLTRMEKPLPEHLPYAISLANHGWKDALRKDRALALGLNTYDGHLTYGPVAEAHGLAAADLADVLR